MHWELVIGDGEYRNEVILPCEDSPFGRIFTVNVCGDELVVNTFLAERIFENFGGFILKSSNFWSESLLDQKLINFLIHCHVQLFGTIFYWCENNFIIFINTDNDNVLVAVTGND